MLDVRSGPREIRAAVLALKGADRDLRRTINAATRDTMNPVWRALVESNARTPLDRKVLGAGAKIKAGNPPVAQAATSRRRLRGGFNPSTQWHAIEFGAATREKTTYQRRSPKGTVHSVTRATKAQLPSRIRTGRVVYPAVKEIAPRVVSLWVQIIVRTYHEAAERAST